MGNRRSKIAFVTVGLLASMVGTTHAQSQTRDGALLGGVAGAVIGGVVGHQKHETGEGALIGGAVGAVAGGLIGNARDQQVRQQQQHYYHYHAQPSYPVYRTYQQVPVTTVRRPVSAPEVINMARSGVSDAVIVAHIQTNGLLRQPDANEVIMLSREGVSDYVITSMQQLGANRVVSQPTYPSNVVVQEEAVYPAPVYQTRVYQPVPVYNVPSYPVYSRQPYYVERRGF